MIFGSAWTNSIYPCVVQRLMQTKHCQWVIQDESSGWMIHQPLRPFQELISGRPIKAECAFSLLLREFSYLPEVFQFILHELIPLHFFGKCSL